MSNTPEFNEEDVRRFYKFLGHEKETEVRILFKVGDPRMFHVKSEREFVEKCKAYNGLGNVYAGLNERQPGGTNASDVISISTIPIDIDSSRDDPKENPATEEELKLAEEAKDKIISDMINSGFKNPLSNFTGNGFQLFYKIPKIVLTEKNRHETESKMQLLQKRLIDEYSKNCQIDNIGDLPRVVRIPGTMNIKGTVKENRPHRLAKIINEKIEIEENPKLLDYILSLNAIEESAEIKPIENLKEECLSKCINYLYKEHKFRNSNGWMRTVSVLSSFFRSIGLSEDKTLALMNEWNLKQYYHESGENEQIRGIVNGIYNKGLFCPNCEKIRKESSGFPHCGLKEIFVNVKLGNCCGKYKNPVVYYNAKAKGESLLESSPNITAENFSVDNVLSDKIDNIKIARQSGKLEDGTFYWIIPILYKGKFIFVAMTEKEEIIPIINNYEVIRRSLDEKERRKISEDEKYFYFDYKDKRYKLNKELYFTDRYGIRTPSRKVLDIKSFKINKTELFNKLVSSLKEYYDHSNSLEYNLVATFVIIPYIHWGYGKTFYLIIVGKEDTGKSTLQGWLAKVQMNGYFAGKSSIAVAVRFTHFFGISLNQDEFEKIGKDEKPIMMGVFNTGLNPEGTYNMVNMNNKSIKDQITSLFTFGAKSFSSNSDNLSLDFEKSFLSRCYTMTATRKNRKTKNINALTTEDNEILQNLCDELFVYCLLNYNKIEKDIKEVEAELENEGLFGRKTDLYSIILGIIKHFNGDYSKEKKELLSREGISTSTDFKLTRETMILECIANKFVAEKDSNLGYIEIPNKEIKDYVDRVLNLNDPYKMSPISISSALKSYSLVRRDDQIKRVGGQGNIKYVIFRSDFLDTLGRFGFNSLINIINAAFRSTLTSLVSQSSPSSQSEQQVPNLTNPSEASERSEDSEEGSKEDSNENPEEPPLFEEDNS